MQDIGAFRYDSHPGVDVMEESGSARDYSLCKSSVSDQALHVAKISSCISVVARH